jgi:prohibitin 2
MKNALMFACVLAVSTMFSGCFGCDTVNPGERGVLVDFGKVDQKVLPEGLHFTGPGENIHEINVRQQKKDVVAPCFSSDLQQVNLDVSVLYRIPEKSVIAIFKDYHGEPFDNLVAPRVQEAIKEATATRSAEQIVKDREAVKTQALESLRHKVGDVLIIEDLIIANVGLSAQLSASIEAKMVQEQKAAQAKYTQQEAQINADTKVLEAEAAAKATLAASKAEAESIDIRGKALERNPGVIQLELVNRWNGVSPQIVGGGTQGLNIVFPAASTK